MSFDSDFDDDIDKLLDEIDTAGSQKSKASISKPGSAGASGKNENVEEAEQQSSSAGAKLTLNSDGNGFKVNYGGGGFKLSDLKNKAPSFGSPSKDPLKSVRFTENPSLESTKSTSSIQAPKPNLISSLLTGPTPDFDAPSSPNPNPASTPNFMSSTPKAFGAGIGTGSGSGTGSKSSDWLGISSSGGGGDISLSPTLSPKRQGRQGPNSTHNSTVNFDDDDDVDELLKSVNEQPSSRGKTAAFASNPKPSSATKKDKEKEINPAGPAKTMPTSKTTSGFDLDDDFWPKPSKPAAATTAAPSIAKNETFDKPEPGSDFRSRLLQKAALSRESTGGGGGGTASTREESPFESRPKTSSTPPTSLLSQTQNQPQQQANKSIVDVLPFLSKKSSGPPQEESEPLSLEANAERSSLTMNINQNLPPPATTTTKKGKKGGAAAATAAPTAVAQPQPPYGYLPLDPSRPHHTLNLPSHLIDEDELKSMCNSLKTLYMNQLEMQEKSYQEQMECITQSHMRKEELLREEIKLMHKEYDTRLERLKNELLESETKLPVRYQNELSAMASLTQQLQSQMKFHEGTQNLSQSGMRSHNVQYTPNISLTNQNPSELNSPRSVHNANVNANTSTNVSTDNGHSAANLLQEVDKVVQERLATFLQAVEANLPKIVESSIQNQAGLSSFSETNKETNRELTSKLDNMQKKLDTFAKFKMEEESQKNMQIIESEKKLQEELSRLYKHQRRMKETIVKAAVASISQTLQYVNEESLHKKDKIASQLKEFRKDVRRVLFDLEAKNEVAQKSNTNLEGDQKQIMKSMRELQTLIQVHNARSSFASEFNLSMSHPNLHQSQSQNQSQSQQLLQQQQQNEMELKLLKEERNSLADSLAQVNVERRKLNEEKINFERDKMDFEREKNRLRDLEVQFRVKITEAEDMKKQADEVRKIESSKAMEGDRRLSELEKEKAALKEQQFATDSRLRMREQKLIQEKTELMREKEFLEKLRDQSLCPGCMKSLSNFNLASLSRSEGDGLDISTVSTMGDISSKFIQQQQQTHPFVVPNPEDAAYFQRESLRLDDLYYKHFHSK